MLTFQWLLGEQCVKYSGVFYFNIENNRALTKRNVFLFMEIIANPKTMTPSAVKLLKFKIIKTIVIL